VRLAGVAHPGRVTLSVLEDTVAARWRRRLVGARPDQKRHWRTKVTYYDAVFTLLESGSGDALSWRTIVDAVRPRGHRSTFYEVAGPNAKHPLVGAYLEESGDAGIEAMQIALIYRRGMAVQQLIDETKVWSYWPHREGMPCADDASLGAAVAAWTRRCPKVAAALGYAPPMCAVEDLLLVRRGQLSAHNAVELLSTTMRNSLQTVSSTA
jgi:hypothetical protein